MEYGNSFGMFSNHQSKSGQSGRMMGKKPFNALSFAMGETEETDMDDMFKASSSSAEANSSLSSNCSFQIPGGSNKEVLSSTPASTPKSSPYFNGTNVQPSPKTTSSTPPTTGLLRNRVAETNGKVLNLVNHFAHHILKDFILKAEVGLRPSKAVTFALSAECQASQAHLNVSEAEDEPPMDHQEVHQEPPDEEAEEDDPPIKEPGMKKMKLMEPINVAKLELEFKDLVERVIQERDEDKQRLELYLESFKFKASLFSFILFNFLHQFQIDTGGGDGPVP